MITLRCPVCGLTANVRAVHRLPVITCPHTNTVHDAKRVALMVKIPQMPEGEVA